MARLKIDRAVKMKQTKFVEMWPSQSVSSTVLHNTNAVFRPGAVSVTIGTKSRSACGDRRASKQIREVSAILLHQIALLAQGQESSLRFLRIQVLISDPRHSPVDVRSFRVPR